MRHLNRHAFALLCLFPLAFGAAIEKKALPVVSANDNRRPAGHLSNGVLEIHLEIREGRWYPEAEGGAHRDVYAFAEQGHDPQSSGPLIRVPKGTQLRATVRNSLPLEAKIYGLHRHPGDAEAALIFAAGETREVQFLAGEVGTYLYWATTSGRSMEQRDDAETSLSGAFVVDDPQTKKDDRILVIGFWTKGGPGDDSFLSINGKSWPYTERLSYKIGEPANWRILNPTESDHAMHLHGFYFTVDGVGNGESFETYAAEQRRLAVTEHIDPGHVFEMTWMPERAGNWLFHCHMLSHISPVESAPKEVGSDMSSSSSAHAQNMGMNGMVMGITVLPGVTPQPAPSAASATRKLQLVISDNPGKIPFFSLAVNDLAKPSTQDEKKPPSLLGPPIFLTRGEAAEVEVKNQSSSSTVIHWHGMQLESYYDGVAGWTGSGQQITPAVAPGTSFVARMTPPRAGTFIYHTHWHDSVQLLNGLYGPLIVLEPGQKYDAEHDRTFVFSAGRYPPFGYMLLVNGHPQPDPIELSTSTRYRLRLINITDNIGDLDVRLMIKGIPVQWKVIAKDGADLPPAQLRQSEADMNIAVGETYDVEYEAASPGLADLEIRVFSFPTPVTLPLKFVAAK